MSSKKYPVGARVLFKSSNILGTIVENYKLPGDICILWDTGQNASYDEDFLDEHCEKTNEFRTL